MSISQLRSHLTLLPSFCLITLRKFEQETDPAYASGGATLREAALGAASNQTKDTICEIRVITNACLL